MPKALAGLTGGEDATDIVEHDKFALVALDKTQHLQIFLQRQVEGSGSRLAARAGWQSCHQQ